MATHRRKRVPEDVVKALETGMKEPKLAEVLFHFVEFAGGVRSFTRMMFDEFVAAKVGSLSRQRILQGLLSAMRHVNDKSSHTIEDMGVLTREDLEYEIQEAMEKVAGEEPEPARPPEPAAAGEAAQAPGAQEQASGGGPARPAPAAADELPGPGGPADPAGH